MSRLEVMLGASQMNSVCSFYSHGEYGDIPIQRSHNGFRILRWSMILFSVLLFFFYSLSKLRPAGFQRQFSLSRLSIRTASVPCFSSIDVKRTIPQLRECPSYLQYPEFNVSRFCLPNRAFGSTIHDHAQNRLAFARIIQYECGTASSREEGWSRVLRVQLGLL